MACPSQGSPPLRGAGLVQLRVRFWKPRPQRLLHTDHSVHVDQPPLTVAIENYFINHYIHTLSTSHAIMLGHISYTQDEIQDPGYQLDWLHAANPPAHSKWTNGWLYWCLTLRGYFSWWSQYEFCRWWEDRLSKFSANSWISLHSNHLRTCTRPPHTHTHTLQLL